MTAAIVTVMTFTIFSTTIAAATITITTSLLGEPVFSSEAARVDKQNDEDADPLEPRSPGGHSKGLCVPRRVAAAC